LTYLDQHQLSIEKARDAYRQQFDIGQRSLLDLLDTENELFQAKRSFIAAEYDLLYAYARTHASMGSLYSALGITQQDAGSLPEMKNNDNDNIAQNCPLETTDMYVVNKDALNARANEQIAQAPAASVKTPMAVSAAPATQNLSASKTAVLNGLQKWRDAWVGMNPQNYFDMYSKKYTSRESWKAARKARLLGAQKISLNLTDIKVVIADDKHMTTSFRQDYQSASYKDVLEKTLYWEEIGGTWLIVNETVDGPPNARQW
jgi:adhesin transport system outer membrane protein